MTDEAEVGSEARTSDEVPHGRHRGVGIAAAATRSAAGEESRADSSSASEGHASAKAETTAKTETPAKAGAKAAASTWGTRSHILVALLCALLGFALVVQVRATRSDAFSLLRQDDLVRLLDEITLRNDQLKNEQTQLVADRNTVSSGADAQRVARRNAEVQGILAGTIAVHGPGIELRVVLGDQSVPASSWVNLIEELRNSGAEAIEIGDVRVGASSWVGDWEDGLIVDGHKIESPVTVRAIGDSQTLEVALGIPGGALATLRSHDATTTITRVDDVEITSIRELTTPSVATPAPDPSATSG